MGERILKLAPRRILLHERVAQSTETQGLTSRQLAVLYVDQFDRLVRTEEDLELMNRAVAQMEEGALNWGQLNDDGTVHAPTRQELSVLLTIYVELLGHEMVSSRAIA